jgi:hypothetical protein
MYARIYPQSQRASYGPGETLRFVLPESNIISAGSACLEFRLRLGKPAGTTGLTGIECNMSRFGGAWSVIKQLTLESNKLGVVDQLKHANRTASTIKAMRSESGLELDGRAGALEFSSLSLIQAQLVCQSKHTTANGLAVSLKLSRIAGPWSQDMDLSSMGGGVLSVMLAQNSEALRSTAAATFDLVDVGLAVTMRAPKPFPPLRGSWLRIETMDAQVDTGRKNISYNSVAAPNCIGFVLTFNLTSNLAALASDQFALQRPTDLTEVSYRINGMDDPIAYPIEVVGNAADEGQDNNEMISTALELLGGKLPNTSRAPSVFANGLAGSTDASSRPAFFALGVKFPMPRDLTKNSIQIELVSGVTSAAPVTAFIHFVSAL